jgi:hypothetical protein
MVPAQFPHNRSLRLLQRIVCALAVELPHLPPLRRRWSTRSVGDVVVPLPARRPPPPADCGEARPARWHRRPARGAGTGERVAGPLTAADCPQDGRSSMGQVPPPSLVTLPGGRPASGRRHPAAGWLRDSVSLNHWLLHACPCGPRRVESRARSPVVRVPGDCGRGVEASTPRGVHRRALARAVI